MILFLQLVVTGDFFQLPPVSKGNRQMKFAFEAQTWNQVIERKLMLTKVFRQKDQGSRPLSSRILDISINFTYPSCQTLSTC